ncbi:hypothetical protein LBO01_27970 [Companilactobacillus paralimentarius]|nr:hypothetical protein LBO01_27970 [Companilactobacillus paralimentarius]
MKFCCNYSDWRQYYEYKVSVNDDPIIFDNTIQYLEDLNRLVEDTEVPDIYLNR